MTVIETAPFGARTFSLRRRLVLATLGLGLLAVSAIAWRLEPDARGQGTHQQLGLPPCTLMMLFNVRCPACGMTTAWSHMVRGQVPSAVRANAGGALLAALGILAAPWLLISAARGRWLWRGPSEGVCVALVAAALGVTLADWAWRLCGG